MTEGETDEAEESDGAGDKATPSKSSSGRKHSAGVGSSAGHRTLRPPTPIHGTAASSPPPSSSVASPRAPSKTRKEPVASTSLSFGKSMIGLDGGQRVKVVRNRPSV